MKLSSPDTPLTPRMARILQAAAERAKSFGHEYVGTEHLLLALIEDQAGIAGHVLAEFGASERAKNRVLEIINSEGYSRPSNEVVGPDGSRVGYLTSEGIVDRADTPETGG